LLNVRDRGLPFSVLDRIPLLGELGLVEPKLTLGQPAMRWAISRLPPAYGPHDRLEAGAEEQKDYIQDRRQQATGRWLPWPLSPKFRGPGK